MLSSADLTRRELTFGAIDSTTGWPAKVYTESTIRGSIQPQGANLTSLPCGGYAKYPHTLFTPDVIHEGDQITDAYGTFYEVNTVTRWSWLNLDSHATCELIKKQLDSHPASSGTWHLDSDSLTTDPCSRHKVYFDAWREAVYTDNGVGAVSHYCFDGVDFPVKYWFLTDLWGSTTPVDVLCVISKEPASAKTDINRAIYAFEESVPINIYAVNKSTITATNLVEQEEQAIRKVVTDHPLGSIREISSVKHNPIDLGDRNYLANTTVTIKYTRCNDDYPGSAITLTYGTGGSAGTFTFPNVTKVSLPNVNNDIFTKIPGRIGERLQRLGAKSLEVQLTCNLDMEPPNLTWKRPQATTPKTDIANFEVFLDIMHNALAEEYQTLTLDWGSFKVRLFDMQPSEDGANNTIILTFKEYVAANALSQTYKQRFGIA